MFSSTLIHVPHASVYIPAPLLSAYAACDIDKELLLMTDHFCDDLFSAGVEMLCAPVSRLVCDVERFINDEDEIMSVYGMGAVYTKCSDGTPLRKVSEDERQYLLQAYYRPHHAKLTEAVDKRLSAFGYCIIIDGHSFSANPLPYEEDQSADRPDICIGSDSFHTSAELRDFAVSFFRQLGYRVEVNRPFSGSLVPLKHYGKEKAVSSVMVEIKRSLYMTEDAVKTGNYPSVKKDISDFIHEIEKCNYTKYSQKNN